MYILGLDNVQRGKAARILCERTYNWLVPHLACPVNALMTSFLSVSGVMGYSRYFPFVYFVLAITVSFTLCVDNEESALRKFVQLVRSGTFTRIPINVAHCPWVPPNLGLVSSQSYIQRSVKGTSLLHAQRLLVPPHSHLESWVANHWTWPWWNEPVCEATGNITDYSVGFEASLECEATEGVADMIEAT